MKVFIPPLGTRLVLTADWHFDLPADHINRIMMRIMHRNKPSSYFDQAVVGGNMLPAGTELIVRTIDVRQGQQGHERIGFSVKLANMPATRFIVRGADANKIEAEVLP